MQNRSARRFATLSLFSFASVGVGLAAVVVACGGDERSAFVSDPDAGPLEEDSGNGPQTSFPDPVVEDAGPGEDAAPPPPIPIVYAHSPSTLYKVDPATKDVTEIA